MDFDFNHLFSVYILKAKHVVQDEDSMLFHAFSSVV